MGYNNDEYIMSENIYKTCDLYLAALLDACGCVVKNTMILQKRVYFCFDYTEILDKVKSSYFLRQCPIDALTFVDRIKSLKSLCASILANELKKG